MGRERGKPMEIQGKKAFITGAASGIGRATALAMARSGTRLFLTDINQRGLEETCHMIEGNGGEVCMMRAFDISDYAAVKAFADEIHAGFGPLDIVANIAGIALFAQVEDMSHAHWEKIMNVNLWGPIHGVECFVPEMVRAGRQGHVVFVSSTAGIIGLPWHVAYTGAKHALVGICEVLRFDLRKHHISASVILPGAVDTGLVNTVEIIADEKAAQRGRRHFRKIAIPPEAVADLIIEAIRKNRFMVITTPDIKVLYFFKRCFPPLYRLVMTIMTWLMDKTLTRKTLAR